MERLWCAAAAGVVVALLGFALHGFLQMRANAKAWKDQENRDADCSSMPLAAMLSLAIMVMAAVAFRTE